MAEELLEAVERLQSRLSENVEPRKLLKTLRRLGELPVTVDILVETGVGKAVNSLRKHDLAGELAKSLVAKWKKLLPQSSDRPSNSHSSHTPSRGRHEAGGGGHHRRPRSPSPQLEEEPSYMDEHEEEMMMERGNRSGYSPSPPRQQHYSPHPRGGGYQSEEYQSPRASPPPPPPSSPARKDVRHGKPHKEPGRSHQHGSHGDRNRDRDEERHHRHAARSDDGERAGKKRGAETEPTHIAVHKTAKHSRQSTVHESKREKEREEKKKGGADAQSRAPKDQVAEEEDDFKAHTMSFESFLMYDAPTPVRKKKKPSSSSSHGRPSHASSASSSSQARTSHSAPASSSSSKASKTNGTKSSKRADAGSAPVAATPEKRRRVVESVPTLPDISLPAIQPNYRPLPSIDLMPLSPQRRKVPLSNGEEDTGFTGKRFNSKMVVYSGTKTAYLPKMLTLYEQCIRVLQNNIDSIDEVGGVPYEILEPVLVRCTPEQLYRIEQCNQCFMEESDELWMKHCQRDFKGASPQEYESWREMYVRLHDEREERLRRLTQNITSAQANKPKVRQVKMAFVDSTVKPPRDVRRRQERFGTTGGTSSASSNSAAPPIKIRPASSYSSSSEASCFPSASSSSFSQSSPPHGPARPSVAAAAVGGGGAGAGGTPGREKPQVKKIAPMMAKTIKAFKNRFSRR